MNLTKENEILGNKYLTEVSKKNVLLGLDKISLERNPDRHDRYGSVELNKHEGLFDNMEYFDPPLRLPKDSVFVTDQAFREKVSLQPDRYFLIYITDKRIALKLYTLATSSNRDDLDDFLLGVSSNDYLESFYDKLYKALNIERNTFI